MGLYRRKDSNIWWMCFCAEGKQYRKSTGTANKKLAEKILGKVETQIVEGRWFDVDKAKQYTLDDMMDRFMSEHAPTKEPRTQKSYRNSLVHLKAFFSDTTLDKIDTDAIMQYVHHRRSEGCRPGTRNRELAMLSKAFNLARLWKWTKENPCQLIKRENEDNDIGRCLSEKEEQSLLKACKGLLRGQLYEMVVIALNTGIREGEILKMRWERIDFFGKTFESCNEKTNSWRTVPMNETVYSLLKEKAKVRSLSGYVFTTSEDTPILARNMLREWYKALKRAGITGFRFHDLRHTVGTRLGRAGQDIHAIANILDHSQLSTTRRYVKHNTESMRKGLNVLERMHG
jgi:integrase